MRIAIVPVAAASLLLCPCTGQAGAAGRASAACGPARAPTLTRAAGSRVYARGSGETREYFACLHGIRRPIDLGGTQCMGTGDVSRFTLQGKFVAWQQLDCGLDSGAESALVADLRTRRRVRGVSVSPLARTDETANNPATFGALLLGPRGTLAWTAIGAPGGVEVRVSGSTAGCQRADAAPCLDRYPNLLLDHGPAIEPRSLRLSGNTLTWSNGGEARSAHLG